MDGLVGGLVDGLVDVLVQGYVDESVGVGYVDGLVVACVASFFFEK